MQECFTSKNKTCCTGILILFVRLYQLCSCVICSVRPNEFLFLIFNPFRPHLHLFFRFHKKKQQKLFDWVIFYNLRFIVISTSGYTLSSFPHFVSCYSSMLLWLILHCCKTYFTIYFLMIIHSFFRLIKFFDRWWESKNHNAFFYLMVTTTIL